MSQCHLHLQESHVHRQNDTIDLLQPTANINIFVYSRQTITVEKNTYGKFGSIGLLPLRTQSNGRHQGHRNDC
ncbi:hypothetical protein Hanom_Chr06g00484971 [Helianthus anomalus]